MRQPLVSIVTSTYNRKAFLMECIQSVQAQELSDWEMLVCDDGSDDGTVQAVLDIDDERVILVPGEHSGIPSVARNRGLTVASGKFITFLDDDDMLCPYSLQDRVSALYKAGWPEKECFVCALAYYVYGDAGYEESLKLLDDGELLLRDLKTYSGNAWESVHAQTVMVPREIIDKYGNFDESRLLRFGEDRELWARWIYNWVTPVKLGQGVCFYRVGDNWQSKITAEEHAVKEEYRKQAILGYRKAKQEVNT